MFRSSTHFKFWIFDDEDELLRRRQEANRKFIQNNINRLKRRVSTDLDVESVFLTFAEEQILVKNYQSILKDFCRGFTPPMPRTVESTAMHYFKRFYMNNSLMEHHPKHIMVTSVYLAAKTEEFNISMDHFVQHVKGDRDKAAGIVLHNELLVLQKINYQLIVWHPYRPLEGFIIDIKTRYPACRDPDRFRRTIEFFFDQCFLSDIHFLFSPNQLALLAILYAADESKESLEGYLHILFNGDMEEINAIKKCKKKAEDMMSNIKLPPKNQVATVKNKLEYFHQLVAKHNPKQKMIEEPAMSSDNIMPYSDYLNYRNNGHQ